MKIPVDKSFPVMYNPIIPSVKIGNLMKDSKFVFRCCRNSNPFCILRSLFCID